MAITLELSRADGTILTHTVESGAAVPVDPSTRVRVYVDGALVEPTRITRSQNLTDVTLTLPDHQTVCLVGFTEIIS